MSMNISPVNHSAGYKPELYVGGGEGQQETTAVPATVDSVSKDHSVVGTVDKKHSAEVKELIKSFQGQDTTLERSVNKETNTIVYKIKDKATGDLIRQIPEEKILEMVANLMERSGILIDKKV